MRPKRIIVVGGGAAGVSAAIAARKQSKDAHIALITDETCEPYEKPQLSKKTLLEAVPRSVRIAGSQGIESHNIHVHYGSQAESIDRRGKRVTLRDKSNLQYDSLVLCTGARNRCLPLLPPTPGKIYYLRSLTDAYALRKKLRTAKSLVVVGGGVVGLEVAAASAELGVKTTIVETSDRILCRIGGRECSELVQAKHQERGVEFRFTTSVVNVEHQTDGIKLFLADGGVLVADLALVGVGAIPNDELAANAGLDVRNGVIVDEHCRTSDPNILAAGDVACFPRQGGHIRLENWRHALDQGTVAGQNAVQSDSVYAAIPSFWSEQFDLYIQWVGWRCADPCDRLTRRSGSSTLLFELSGRQVASATGINAQTEIAIVRRLIERKIEVNPVELTDSARPLSRLLSRAA